MAMFSVWNNPIWICKLINRSTFNYGNDEKKLQDAIEEILKRHQAPYKREHAFDPANRIDFLIGSIGIEVKIKGSVTAVDRQLHRYAQCSEVSALILVTTLSDHRMLPQEILTKPLYIVHLLGIM